MLQQIKHQLLSFAVHYIAPMLRAMYPASNFPYTLEELLRFPPNSLGLQTALKLQAQQYNLIKQFETHDLKHVLFNYDMNSIGECRMVFFLFGNGNKTLPVCMSMVLSIVLFPSYYATFKKDYQRGKRYEQLSNNQLCSMLLLPLDEVRRKLHKKQKC